MPSIKNGCISIKRVSELSEAQIDDIVHHINQIYLEEEFEVWPQDGTYERINSEEYSKHIADNEIIAAIDEETNLIASSLRLYRHDNIWFFGVLVTVPNYRGQGIASRVIEFTEQVLRDQGEKEMFIELLMSEELDLPRKLSMKDWYEHRGYEAVTTIPFEQKDPVKAKLMKGECYFLIMKKPL